MSNNDCVIIITGHSRTIVGMEQLRSPMDGCPFRVVSFDPSHRPGRIRALLRPDARTTLHDFLFLKQNIRMMKKEKYQLVVVRGVMQSDQEYDEAKGNFQQTVIT